MDLVCIPYHDWRKIEMEGSRTRDSHLISHFAKSKNVGKVLVINRPTSYPELLFNKRKIELKGKVVISKGNLKLYQITDKLFVLDYITSDLLTPVLKKRLWIFKSFGYAKFINFYKECISFLGIKEHFIFSNNIFSLNFAVKSNTKNVVFDAYDNLVFFPHNEPIKQELVDSYLKFKDICKFWTTNSTKNVEYYKDNYGQENCFLVKNGVDIETFERKYEKPEDLVSLKKPIVGFGGKITHLFDYDLFNYCVDNHPDKEFVIVGQILDKEVFSKIKVAPNVHYLGDKHYSQYSSYVANFDIGIIPYVTNHLESGVDSIKVYEYIAAGLNAVGTTGGGMPDLADFLFIANDKFEFSEYISKALNKKSTVKLPEIHTWAYKSEQIITYMKQSL